MNTEELCKVLIKENPKYIYTKTFKRHIKDLKTLDKELYRFNEELAQTYIMVLESFRHSKGELAGTLIHLENWQKASIGIAMGWERKNAKGQWVRRFSTLMFFMARKGGKTLISAGLALADSLIRVQQGSSIVTIATKRDQALLAWGEIRDMILGHKDLKKKFRKVGNKLFSSLDKGTIHSLGRDSRSEDGMAVSILIVDEYHAFPNSSLKDVCTSSMGARQQPLTIIISTAGFNLGSPLLDELDYARKIIKGSITDESYFAFLAEPNRGDEPYSIDTLKKSNPNINVSVSEEFLLKEMEQAKERPDMRTNYLTKYLNIFVNASEEFIPIKEWQACEAPDEYEIDFSKIKTILVGADLSVSDDMTAIVTAYIDLEDNMYIETEVFLPEERIEFLEKRFRAPLTKWIQNGYLTTTKNNYIDYTQIYDTIVEKIKIAEEHSVEIEVYYDAFKFKSIKSSLENEIGFTDAFPVNQGFLTLSEPLAMMVTYIRSGKISYKNNPVMNWCMSNVEVQTDSYGNKKIDKSSAYRKIDPVAALGNIFYGLLPKIMEDESDNEIHFI